MRSLKKKERFIRSLILLTFIYAFCTFIFCFAVISRLNASIITHSGSLTDAANINSDSNEIHNMIIKDVPSGAEDVSFSYDDKYYTYLYNSEIYVKETESNKLVRKISEKSGIKKSMLMGNRNIIMYFRIFNGKLTLKTYNIDNGLISAHKSFAIPVNSIIKSVDYSSATNLIFINMEQGSGNNVKDKLYYMNIMKNVKQINTGHLINDMLLAKNSPALYYEDENNNLYCNSKPISGVNRGYIIGIDANDNVYAKSMDDKSAIYIVNNNNLIKTLRLHDLNYISFYTNKNDVYAIYKNYILSLTSNAKLAYANGLKFIGMGGSNVYYRDKDNNIIGLKRTI